MPLTDTQIKALKPETKPRKVANEKGLYLPVQSTGGKLWRLKYRIDGKEKLLALEVYPDVGLKDACKKRNQARRLLADGIAPGEHPKAHKNARAEAMEPRPCRQDPAALERDVFPWIGGEPIATT